MEMRLRGALVAKLQELAISFHDDVPAGTVVMGLVCGTDGDWHLAPKSVSPTTNPKGQVAVVRPAAASARSMP